MSEDPEFRTVYAPPRFPVSTGAPVRFLSVVLRGKEVGYLWAAATDDAAGFMARKAAGGDAFNASIQWADRLQWAKANGLTPLQALRHWVGDTEDAKAGAVSGEEREATGLSALEGMAN
ncbi:hypothetical protein [Streptomyces avermitilis]|uniref:hypothetical protein n=1 Tax=Streptomyces avermitilis TaxID=33903 RepID=UPI0038097ED0